MKIDFNQWGHEEEKLDYDKINAIACGNLQTIFNQFLPGGRIVSGNYVCGTICGGAGDSCSTNIHTGVGSEFSAGIVWGDPIDLVAKIQNIKQSEAAQVLTEFLSINSSTPIPKIEKQSSVDKYEAGKKNALDLWVNSDTCPQNHPYLTKKQVNTDNGIRLHRESGNIIIPLYDEKGELWSVQRVSPDGSEKKINNNGKMGGNFFTIEGERDTVYICEGYATAKTVAMATGKTAIMAVSTGNLAPVAEKLCKLYPGSQIIFAADNDQDKLENPGITAAQKAVKQIGRGTVVAPPFPAGEKGDWNDYAIIYGGNAVRGLLLSNKRSQVFVDIKTIALAEPQFLIEDAIETPCTGMVFGPSGGGKTFVALDMGFHIACGRKWLGKEVKQGPVFYVCGEGRHAIPRRMKAWETHHNVQLPYNSFLMSSARIDFSPESVRDMVFEIDHLEAITGPPAVIIVDTMARALPGDADENSSKDVGSFIDECDRLQTKYNCVVLIIHHTGHADSASKRARGSSAIKGAMDVEILITKDRTIEWTKTKDMEPHAPIKFELLPVKYGEGKRDGSCVMKYDLDFNPRTARETAYRKAAREALKEAVEIDAIGGKCMLDTWVNCFAAMFPEKAPKALRAALMRKDGGECQKMIDAGEVEQDGKFWVPVASQKETTKDMFKGLI